jgi:Domain of Unknown Function (DUF1080)
MLNLLLACSATLLFAQAAPVAPATTHNKLTPAEKREGWKLLFDGVSTSGLRGLRRAGFPAWSTWKIEDGTLTRHKAADGCEGPGDLITVDQFESFELRFEYRLARGGNSGVKYLVDESKTEPGSHSGLGFEFQILDDDNHPDAKKGTAGNRRSGGLYDLVAPSSAAARPPGEWNEVRIVVAGLRMEHWLNGTQVMQIERTGPALTAAIAASKFKGYPWFGTISRGHILFQDHNDEVSFRNIKIKAPRPAGKPRGPAKP